jgi:chromosomal replication initiation ATPase DnaA
MNYFAIPGLKYKIYPALTDAEKASIILEVIQKYFHIEMKDIASYSRKKGVAYIRHLCMYFLKLETGLTLCKIGELLSFKTKPLDHSTVICGCREIQNLIDTDKSIKKEVYEIKSLL